MTKRLLTQAVLIGVLMCVGCTSVQKGSAVGAGMGAAGGAAIGHFFVNGLGGLAGAGLGLTVGTAAGAIAAESYYGDEEQNLAARDAEVAAMNSRLEASDARAAQLSSELETGAAQHQALLEAHDKQLSELEELRNKVGGADGEIQVEQMAGGGVKITILSEVLFDSGKASLTSKGKTVLTEAASIISRDYPNAQIEVRGHTDNVPILHSGYKSNWELSCDRALSVLHGLMEQQKFAPERLSVTGFGDTRPVASNDTAEGRRKNRRAEIVVSLQPAQVAARES